MKYDDTISCCALNRIFGFKPMIALAMIEELGSPSAVFELSRQELDNLLGPFSPQKELINDRAYYLAAEEIENFKGKNTYFVPWCSPYYPDLLKECRDAPIGLYVKSISSPETLFNNKNHIAVVGTRDVSEYGKEWSRKIIECLSRTGLEPAIVSGLAIGTDIVAHTKALDSGLPTIAVMATGIDSVYPYRHTAIAERIAMTPRCALITDYPPGTAPLRINFLRRNRIIAGMSKSTILIESKTKGGGMLTARLAFSYSRDVYALPGRADDIRSAGCNILLREQVAEPVISEENLIKSLGMKYIAKSEKEDPEKHVALKFRSDSRKTEILTTILRTVRSHRGIDIGELAEKTGFQYKDVLENTALLEADGFIITDLMQRCFIRTK